MSMERGQRYSADVPLRWSDMDAYGHVNNVQFLRLLEDARVIGFQEWFGQDRSLLDEGVLVARHEIEYLAPLLFRVPPIVVEMWATKIGGAGFDLAYEVRDGHAGDAHHLPGAHRQVDLVEQHAAAWVAQRHAVHRQRRHVAGVHRGSL